MPWSKAQQKAIETKQKNLLIAAAAGSGKTSVLVERIIQRILAGDCDVDKLLVVTFTHAAAAEMRMRIEHALQEALEAQPDSLILERQLVLLSNASICTLHAFCQNLLRQNFSVIDLDPQFRLSNEQELRLIRQDVLEEMFEQEYAAGNVDFLQFVDAYGSERGDAVLYGIIEKLFHYAQSQPFPSLWLDSLTQGFSLPESANLQDTPWFMILQQTVHWELSACDEAVDRLITLAGQMGADFYLPVLQQDQEMIRDLQDALENMAWDEFSQQMGSLKFATLRAPKGTEEELKKLFLEPRNVLKKRLTKLRDSYFSLTEQELLADLRQTAPQVQTMVRLTKAFSTAFAAAKKEKNLLDFNDLEHLALEILCDAAAEPGVLHPSDTARSLQQKYQEIMVDEYQDTNGVQEALLTLLRNPERPNLFVVGDVKQSIYRFRLADPSLFLKKYQDYPLLGEAYQRIDLSQNFRSRAEILSAVNFLFSQVMVPGTMELAYDEAAALYPGAVYPEGEHLLQGPVELDFIDQEPGVEDEEDAEELSGFSLEAEHIAQRLKALMQEKFQVYDAGKKAYRPMEWRDAVVLLRSVKGKADVLLETLRQHDIPAYASVDAGYFEETEIRVMLALLAVLDNARQDIPLAAVLYSPIGGFSVQELAALRLAVPEGDLFGVLLQANDPELPLAEVLREKTAAFLRKLTAWRNLARRVSVPELIWQLYRDTGYYEYVGGMPGGLLRQANLRMLCDRAADYEKTNFRGLFRFLRFIDRMQDLDTDLAVARTLGESENVVRIMSIHKSKGLEFPVVLLADCGKRFNLQESHEEILLHRTLGIGPYVVDLEKSLRYPSFARWALEAKLIQENKAEELRVLYVALTRAKEKLILVGSLKKLSSRAETWCHYLDRAARSLPEAAVLGAQCYFDWLGMAVSRHADGEPLRKLAEYPFQRVNPAGSDTSHWQVKIYAAHDIQTMCAADHKEDPCLEQVKKHLPLPGTPAQAWVKARLDWQYDAQGLEDVPAKLSVTELKRRFSQDEAVGTLFDKAEEHIFQRPRFIQEASHLTGVEYGTLLHSALQHIDLQGNLTPAGISAQLDRMVDEELLLPIQRGAIDARVLARFFASPLGRRLCQAKRVWRELPFGRELPAQKFYPAVADAEETLFIQGIVDVLFEEADGLVLLDYKTDRDTQPERIKARYQLQIDLYSEAVSAILGKTIQERYLYLLHDGSWLKI